MVDFDLKRFVIIPHPKPFVVNKIQIDFETT